MKVVVGILCGVGLLALLVVGSCTGLFFWAKDQAEEEIFDALKGNPALEQYLGEIVDMEMEMMEVAKQPEHDDLMFISIEGTKTNGTLRFGMKREGNGTVEVMELELADSTTVNLMGKLEFQGWGVVDDVTPREEEPTKDVEQEE